MGGGVSHPNSSFGLKGQMKTDSGIVYMVGVQYCLMF